MNNGRDCKHGQLARSCEICGLEAENAALKDDLQWVERCANHHGQKAHMTAAQALSFIQHYPPIKAITKAYADGKMPTTLDPYAEIDALKADRDSWAQQASDRVKDCADFIGQIEALKAELAAMREQKPIGYASSFNGNFDGRTIRTIKYHDESAVYAAAGAKP